MDAFHNAFEDAFGDGFGRRVWWRVCFGDAMVLTAEPWHWIARGVSPWYRLATQNVNGGAVAVAPHQCHRSAIPMLFLGVFQGLTPLAIQCHGSAVLIPV